MLRLVCSSLIAMSCSANVWAQWEYPLSIGNRWEYWDAYPPPELYAWTTTVVGDTVMPNGLQYRILRTDKAWGDQYQRQSGQVVYAYAPYDSTERILFDFSRSIGDTVCILPSIWDSVITTVTFDGQATVFGRRLKVKDFYERAINSSMYVLRTVADSIGLFRITYEAGEGGQAVGAIIDGVRYGSITGVQPYARIPVIQPVLCRNFPNPFNPSTTIQFSLHRSGFVTLKVYNALGEQVATIVDEELPAGDHAVKWTPGNLATGTYYYSLIAHGQMTTSRMVFIK
jgi:hypothetical protein